ncbi:hypothetical protein [Falsiroseomonas sp. E2-1-a20]|uniref:hypothetical protein n=1 Tax=Falsiroseomonas sp. E2-1-a20 TaxID=3239300 RepID=UPI003F3AFE54
MPIIAADGQTAIPASCEECIFADRRNQPDPKTNTTKHLDAGYAVCRRSPPGTSKSSGKTQWDVVNLQFDYCGAGVLGLAREK